MVLISSIASLDLNSDFMIRLLHNTLFSKSKSFLQQWQRLVNYLHKRAAVLVATPPQIKQCCCFSLLTENNSSTSAAEKTLAMVAAPLCPPLVLRSLLVSGSISVHNHIYCTVKFLGFNVDKEARKSKKGTSNDLTNICLY